jgi:hypothetical protein
VTPDYSRGYLRLPLNVWLSVFCRGMLTRRQIQLVSVVIRESWGWRSTDGSVHTWTRPLTTRQFAEATGLSVDHLRRDLQVLLDRGILRERAGRYQFIGAPALWITDATSAPDQRELALKQSEATAEDALSNLASKKDYRKQRNVPGFSEADFSTAGGNSSSRSSLVRPGSQGPVDLAEASPARRLTDVITAFVGPLSQVEADALQLWTYDASVAAVWAAVEPAFRQGPVAGRRRLQALLAKRMSEAF